MSKEIQIFKNEQFGQIRTFDENGKVLFCGSDVAKALGYKRPNDAISAHCKGTVKRRTPTNGGMQEMLFVTEGDIYRLAASSELPGADAFESWIFDEVLPSIRKTGGYTMDKAKQNRLEIMERNCRAREASLWLRIASTVKSDTYQQICASYASKSLAGHEVIPLPVSNQRHYTATEVGNLLGVSAHRIGMIAKEHGLKTEEYGAWYHDKSPYSSKEIESFRYNDRAIELFRSFLSA